MSRAGQQTKFARRIRMVPVAVGLGMTLAVTGCGAGQTSQTASQVSAVNGAEGNAGTMLVRDAQLRFPSSGDKYTAGSSADLVLTIVNGGDNPDELVKVTSPNASSAKIGGQTTIPARFAVSDGSAPGADTSGGASSAATSPSASASSSAAPSGSASPSASVSAKPSGAAGVGQVGKISVSLVGLTQDVTPGQKIGVTFVFRDAGPVTLQLPIGSPSGNAG